MTLTLGIGRSFVRTLATRVVAGPTVQIARSPSTVSAATNATGTLTKTPEDHSGVATSLTTYWHSSDPAKLRIDDAVTGAYTWLGSAAQTAYAYADPTAPVDDGPYAPPVYTVATDTLVIPTDGRTAEDFNYADAETFGAGPYDPTGTYMAPNPSPRYIDAPVSAENTIAASTRPGATGTEKMFQNRYNGVNLSAPQLRGQISVSQYAAVGRTHCFRFWKQYVFSDLSHLPFERPLRVKDFETSYQGSGGRCQWSIRDSDTNAGSSVTQSAWDNPGRAQPQPPTPLPGAQTHGPYPGEVIGDASWNLYTYAYRGHTPAAGSASFLVDTAFVTLNGTGPGVVHVGDRIRWISGGIEVSTADFLITGLDDSGLHPTMTVQRQTDLGTTVSYTGDAFFFNDTWTVTFTHDQTGLISAGDYIATMNAVSGWRITSMIDGFHGVPTRNNAGGYNILGESPNSVFAREFDCWTGYARMWVNGQMVMNISVDGLTNATVPCTRLALAQHGVGTTCTLFNIGDNQTLGPGPSYGSSTQPHVPWIMNVTQFQYWHRSEP